MIDFCSTTYELLDDGSLTVRIATLQGGELFTITLSPEDALENVQAAARALGLVVVRPL